MGSNPHTKNTFSNKQTNILHMVTCNETSSNNTVTVNKTLNASGTVYKEPLTRVYSWSTANSNKSIEIKEKYLKIKELTPWDTKALQEVRNEYNLIRNSESRYNRIVKDIKQKIDIEKEQTLEGGCTSQQAQTTEQDLDRAKKDLARIENLSTNRNVLPSLADTQPNTSAKYLTQNVKNPPSN